MRKIILFLALISTSVLFTQEIAIVTASLDQMAPQIVTGVDCFFVVWQDHRVGSGNPNIYGQSIYTDGSTGGPGFAVAVEAGFQTVPVIGYNETADIFTSLWFDQRSATEIYARNANCEGNIDEEWVVGDATTNYSSPEIAFSGSVYLLVWSVRIGAYFETRYIVLDSDGLPLGTIEALADTASQSPDVAFNGEKFLAVWKDSTDSGVGIYGRYFDASGSPDGEAILLIADDRTSEPSVCGIHSEIPEDAAFAIAWQRSDDVTGADVYAAVIGEGSIAPVAICTEAEGQSLPDISRHENGFFIAWQDQRSIYSTDIYGRFLNMGGSPIGDDFAICDSLLSQQAPKIAYNERGEKYLVVWIDLRSGANMDIYGMLIDAPEPSEGPEVSGAFPLPGTYSACDSPMVILLTSAVEIDWETAIISFNGTDFYYGEPEISTEGMSIYFHPGYSAGIVETMSVCLEDIADTGGVHIETPYCWEWIWDGAPPIVTSTNPDDGDSLDAIPVTITAAIGDDGAGVDSLSFIAEINGVPFDLGDSGFYWDGYTITLNIAELGFADFPETVMVTFYASDFAACANEMERELVFYVIGESEGPIASPQQPLDGTITACSNQEIMISVTDDDGVDETTIILSVNSVEFDSLDNMVFVPPLLTFSPPEDFEEGEVEVELLEVRDWLGNMIDSPLLYSFFIDLSPPSMLSASFPEGAEIDTFTTGDLLISTEDNYSSALSTTESKIWLRYSGALVRTWENDSLFFPGPMILGVAESVFFSALIEAHTTTCDTFQICARLADSPDYCGGPLSNMLDTCWAIIYHGSGIDEIKLPDNVSLDFAPNPFNTSLEISYYAPDGGKMEILDVAGHTILRNSVRGAGIYIWDGLDEEGCPLPSGKYSVRLRTATDKITKTAIMLK